MIMTETLNIKKNNKISHTTGLNWVHKIGYYESTKEKEKSDDWIIILDESIQIGQEKALVVLGIREKHIDFSRPLKYHDLVPLKIIVKNGWKAESINELITEMKKDIGNIKYAVADMGNNIRKALELSGIKHIHDVTHRIALIIERIYKKDEVFLEITKQMSKMRLKYLQTSLAYIIPPAQRNKSRYLNISIISDWCNKVLKYNEKNEMKIEELNWLNQYKEFIKELQDINQAICNIEKVLKHNGYCRETKKECEKIFEKLVSNVKSDIVKLEIRKYFQEIEDKKMKAKKFLITSDIIESAFGKYKNYLSTNPMAGITNLILCIAAFSSRLDGIEIKKALESARIKDIKDWTKRFIGKTVMQKRKEAFMTL